MKDEIYTYTAFILIAVNPYQQLPIYGDDAIRQYGADSTFHPPTPVSLKPNQSVVCRF
jgi:myosin heavy subunit